MFTYNLEKELLLKAGSLIRVKDPDIRNQKKLECVNRVKELLQYRHMVRIIPCNVYERKTSFLTAIT